MDSGGVNVVRNNFIRIPFLHGSFQKLKPPYPWVVTQIGNAFRIVMPFKCIKGRLIKKTETFQHNLSA